MEVLRTAEGFSPDSCPSQTRDHAVVRFLVTLAADGGFNKIFQSFPVRGHSFLPCDTDLLKEFCT